MNKLCVLFLAILLLPISCMTVDEFTSTDNVEEKASTIPDDVLQNVGKKFLSLSDVYSSKPDTPLENIAGYRVEQVFLQNGVCYYRLISSDNVELSVDQYRFSSEYALPENIVIEDEYDTDVVFAYRSDEFSIAFSFMKTNISRVYQIYGNLLTFQNNSDPIELNNDDVIILEFGDSRYYLAPFYAGSVENWPVRDQVPSHVVEQGQKYRYWASLPVNSIDSDDATLFLTKNQILIEFLERIEEDNLETRKALETITGSVRIAYFIRSLKTEFLLDEPVITKDRVRHVTVRQ